MAQTDDKFQALLAKTQQLANQIKKQNAAQAQQRHDFHHGGAPQNFHFGAAGNMAPNMNHLQWQQQQQMMWQQHQQQQQQLAWHQQMMRQAPVVQEQGLLQAFQEPQVHLPNYAAQSGSSDNHTRSASIDSWSGLRSVSMDSEMAMAGMEDLLDAGIFDEALGPAPQKPIGGVAAPKHGPQATV